MNLSDLANRDPYAGSTGAGLDAYWDVIAEQFCPYIAPSERSKALFSSTYTLDELTEIGQGKTDVGLFSVAVLHSEWVREKRRDFVGAGNALAARLICDNVVVSGSEGLTWRQAKDIVDWPHYLLKHLYSRVGLMFGKFWTHEETDSLDGRSIPEPPITFMSIRNAIKVRDPRLLGEQVEYATAIEDSEDNGEVILASLLPSEIAAIELTPHLVSQSGLYEVLRGQLS